MGQKNLKRLQFIPQVEVTTPQSSTLQPVSNTHYFKVGDTVDVLELDAQGQLLSVIADNLTVASIDPDTSLTLDSTVDTSGLTGTPYIFNQSIDDGQAAIERVFQRKTDGFTLRQDILAQALDSPSIGKATYDIEDPSLWRAGDTVDILSDEGLVASDITVDSVNVNADATNNKATIVLNSSVDTSGATNPFLLNTSINFQKAILRNQERIDGVDQPVENQSLGVGNGLYTVFRTAALFVQSSSKLFLDGTRLTKGDAGTRAQVSQGTGDAELIFHSLILGTDGNKTQVEVVSGAGLTVTVSGNYSNGFTITVSDDGGTATAKQIADAINADSDARKILQALYGGDGSGVVSAFSPISLAGGADDGTGDYAELQQVFENGIASTGFNILALHIRGNEKNRLNSPPDDDEELVVDYRKASDNVDR